MVVRLIRKSWWVDFRFNYIRYRRRSPENTRTGALAYEASLRHKLALGHAIDGSFPQRSIQSQDLSFKEFANEWFLKYVVTNNKYSEQYEKRKILDASLIPFFGRHQLQSITTEDIERYKAREKARGASNKTINNRLAVLSKCLRCAEEWRGIKMSKIRLLRCPPLETRFLTTTESQLLLEQASGQYLEMLLLALRAGLRQGEIRALQWESIDWVTNSLVVRHSLCDRNMSLVEPKNGRTRRIPLDSEVRELLFARRQNSGYVFINPERCAPFTSHRIVEDLRRMCEKAGVQRVAWHVLRHTFATQLAMRGVPLTVMKELLGHSSITMTMRYSHVPAPALREAIDSLSPRSGVRPIGQPVGNT